MIIEALEAAELTKTLSIERYEGPGKRKVMLGEQEKMI